MLFSLILISDADERIQGWLNALLMWRANSVELGSVMARGRISLMWRASTVEFGSRWPEVASHLSTAAAGTN